MILNSSVANDVCAPFRRAVILPRFGAGLVALSLALAATLAAPARAEKLTLERLFAAPDLSGPSLRGVKISPDGRLVAYLKAREDDKDRFDLWAFDVRKSRDRLLVDSRTLAGADRALSAEEEARRERQRTSAYFGNRGIQLRARQPSPADSAQRRSVRVRPRPQTRRRRAPAHEHGCLRNRCAILAALELRELRARPESPRHRPRHRQGARGDQRRWRRR